MDTREFFDLVLPSEGLRCLAVPKGSGFRHVFCITNEQAAAAVDVLDVRQGANVYMACASMLTDESRLGTNAAKVRSFWLDVDCGPGKPGKPKPYPTARDGAAAVLGMVQALGMPTPYLVLSGVGLHVYWPMDADMAPDAWRYVATLLKAACVAHGLKADPSRTSDAASVLRPVGSHHRKAEPKLVRLLMAGVVSALAPFQALLEGYLKPLGAMPEPAPLPALPAAMQINSDLTGGMDYKMSLADRVADQCGIIGMIRDTLGQVDQPTWYNGLGILAKCEDGLTVAHEWSKGDTRYTHAETQAAIDRVTQHGPASCGKLGEQHPNICALCPHKGKVKSPIVLGRAPEAIAVTTTAPAAPTSGVDMFGQPDTTAQASMASPMTIDFPYGYAWVITGAPFPQLCLKVKVEATDTQPAGHEWKAICNTLFYPVARLGDDTDGYALEMEMEVRVGQKRRFLVETSLITEGGRGLAGRLGKFEIAALPRMEQDLADYIRRFMEKMRAEKEAMEARQHFGWYDDKNFLVGSTMYSPAGPRLAILKGSAAKKATPLTQSGDLETWKRVINDAYNHPGQQALQFCVLLGFAAPLLAIMKQTKGITVFAHSEGTGKGKSTAQQAALSAWGSFEDMQLNDGQVTVNMLNGLCGMYHNLPVMYDELTNMTNAAASKLVYDVGAGKGKDRMGSDTIIKTTSDNWCTILMASGNNLLTEKLGSHRANSSAELARLFEFTVDSVSPLTPNQANTLFPQLAEHYGTAGPVFIQYVISNYDKMETMLARVQAAFNVEADITQGERFWSALAACVLTAATLCRKLDILKFDVTALHEWIIDQIERNRVTRSSTVSDPLELFGKMLSDLWQGILVTKGEGDLRTTDPGPAHVLQDPRGPFIGRAILPRPRDARTNLSDEKSVVMINASAIREWSTKHGVSAREMEIAAVKEGWVTHTDHRYKLGKGTITYSTISGHVRCWVIDPIKMGSDAAASPSVTKFLYVVDTVGKAQDGTAA